ncbi:Cytokine receptor-like factor 3 [Manis javanica]|nr:Cytokine receptor-like factor 3 [Manis javanica]
MELEPEVLLQEARENVEAAQSYRRELGQRLQRLREARRQWRNSSSPGEARELASKRPLSRNCCQMCSSSSPEMLQMLHPDSPGLVPSQKQQVFLDFYPKFTDLMFYFC